MTLPTITRAQRRRNARVLALAALPLAAAAALVVMPARATNAAPALRVALTLAVGSPAAGGGPRFATPTNLGRAVNTAGFEGGPALSADGLTLYFASNRPGGSGGADLWAASRRTATAPFGRPRNLGPVLNTLGEDTAPESAAGGLELYFGSDRGGSDSDLYVTQRGSASAAFGRPILLSAVDSAFSQDHAALSRDGLELVFTSSRPGGVGDGDLWVATRASRRQAFGNPRPLGAAVNSAVYDGEASLAPDGLTLYFASDRGGGVGQRDVWVTNRPSRSRPFGKPRNLGRPVNTRGFDATPHLSADGRTLLFLSDRPGGFGFMDLWQARRVG